MASEYPELTWYVTYDGEFTATVRNKADEIVYTTPSCYTRIDAERYAVRYIDAIVAKWTIDKGEYHEMGTSHN